RCPLCLNPDDPHAGPRGLDSCRDAGQPPATSGADHDGRDLGALLQDLQAAGSLTRDDVGVVEGVNQDSARLGLELSCPDQALVDAGAKLLDVGAVPAG